MASNIKKAGSVIRKSFRSKRYTTSEKENNTSQLSTAETSRYRARTLSASTWSDSENADTSTLANPGTPPARTQVVGLKRGASMTQSMRDAVGNLRQKLRMSTRRSRINVTTVGTRRHTIGGREARLNSILKASSPRSGHAHIKTSLSVETPTKLRREVESLTSNMQALNALTPNTTDGRIRTRKSPPLTNGSLRTPRFAHRLVSRV
ncbi:hypothetical protein BsWGS_07353 [Bradybaena similaris]